MCLTFKNLRKLKMNGRGKNALIRACRMSMFCRRDDEGRAYKLQTTREL